MILLTLPNSCPCEHEVIALTSLITHKYYCENDVKSIISLLDRDVVWLGTAEHEYAAGLETVAEIFRRFAGQVPKCDISGEEYSTLSLGPDACLCAGRLWICHRPLHRHQPAGSSAHHHGVPADRTGPALLSHSRLQSLRGNGG